MRTPTNSVFDRAVRTQLNMFSQRKGHISITILKRNLVPGFTINLSVLNSTESAPKQEEDQEAFKVVQNYEISPDGDSVAARCE